MRLVLDTNIFVSGLLTPRGAPGRLVRAWLELRFELVTSSLQIDELRRVLRYERLRPYIDPDQARDFVENLEILAIVATDLPVLAVSPDPDDNVILAAAIAGAADAVVSGDKGDIVALGAVGGIPIITARDAVERLGLEEQ
ncbi:MAG: putative toxin-antitoxin system toxin component, PIN family [Planctomycetes bacterium]|nr:putative toxin-antitoxin system toxin component, PIN family [Planctomycetota bacterium]